MQFILASVLVFICMARTDISRAETSLPSDFYTREVQPIFDARCVACHSCFNAPCQLNLQNFEGFSRGANKLNIYDGTRRKSVFPSRLWIDAHATAEWRKKGFFDVNTSRQPTENIFLSLVNLRSIRPEKTVSQQVASAAVCPDSMAALRKLPLESSELGMPYGLPPLKKEEISILEKWIEKGAPGPLAQNSLPLSSDVKKQIQEWEKFLNANTLTGKVVSRYIYEHLFLAHIYFPEDKNRFFRLVRSSQACEKGVQEIATRRPNDDPGTKKIFYCLSALPGTVVMKTHIPYQWDLQKLARYKEIFFKKSWSVSALPSYERSVAENPFIAFKSIPVKARYEFLLEDAQYQVATFIKGPVCNGSSAVNSIQEQFYVFFLDPESDNMVKSSAYAKQVEPLLLLPGVFGSDVQIRETPVFYKKLIDHREAYRKARATFLKEQRPEGYTLNDIWNGDGDNSNAVLTVFRHDDNAVVRKGAVGDLSKTVFVLDYPLFERLVYNLVVNFDVFGNISHQLLTRVYMDMIRMEAEEIFLAFLPPEQRIEYRRSWYKGLLAEAKMTYVFPTMGSSEPTAVRFNHEDKNTKKQMVEKILFHRMNDQVRGSLDPINWKVLAVPEILQKKLSSDAQEKIWNEVAAVKAVKATPFAQFFPDLALVKVHDGAKLRVFSLIHNKEHENISWILGESLRMAPDEDSLTIREGYWGSYPNMIFDLTSKKLKDFVFRVKNLKSAQDYEELVTTYGVRRTNPEFWKHYDELTVHQKETQGADFGYLDLTRYSLK